MIQSSRNWRQRILSTSKFCIALYFWLVAGAFIMVGVFIYYKVRCPYPEINGLLVDAEKENIKKRHMYDLPKLRAFFEYNSLLIICIVFSTSLILFNPATLRIFHLSNYSTVLGFLATIAVGVGMAACLVELTLLITDDRIFDEMEAVLQDGQALVTENFIELEGKLSCCSVRRTERNKDYHLSMVPITCARIYENHPFPNCNYVTEGLIMNRSHAYWLLALICSLILADFIIFFCEYSRQNRSSSEQKTLTRSVQNHSSFEEKEATLKINENKNSKGRNSVNKLDSEHKVDTISTI